jgi:putative transposase
VKRSTIRYQPPPGHADYEARLTAAVIDLCGRATMRHYGYRRIAPGLRKAGWQVSTKHVARIMPAEGLLRPPRQRPRPAPGLSGNSITKLPPRQVNDVWTYDFISIRLADGSKLRMLSVLDEYSRFAMPR